MKSSSDLKLKMFPLFLAYSIQRTMPDLSGHSFRVGAALDMVVPVRLRSALGQREVKRSLSTKSHGKALRLARRHATFLNSL